ncbi:hypothetical protein HYV84_06385 [Candidatus Woesearchaeota archaeon]|nr:hypothetical protein [Candidatus Woesearchaeota archaeon]
MTALPESVERELLQLRKDLYKEKGFPSFFSDKKQVNTCSVHVGFDGNGLSVTLTIRVIFNDKSEWAEYSGTFKVVWNQERGYDYKFEPTHRRGEIGAYTGDLPNGRNWGSAPSIGEIYEDIKAYLASIEKDYYAFKKKHYS